MKTFHILHIADLHPQIEDGPKDQLIVSAYSHQIAAISADNQIDLIAATGDLGHQGSDKALKIGFKRLEELRKHAGRTKSGGAKSLPPVIVTPGNHDVSWPPSLSALGSWPSEERFHNFIDCCGGTDYCRPLLRSDEKDPARTLRHNPHPPWYFKNFSNDLSVFVLPLSSADLGGAPIESEVLDTVSDKAELNSEIASGLLKVLTYDIPYVDMAQLTQLDNLLKQWRESDTQRGRDLHKRFERAVKIAVVHHPLLPVPGEQEFRPFDTVANGADVAKKLSTLGFQLVLYGHKHRLGCHVNHGMWENHFAEDGEKDIGEITGLVGGHLIVGRIEALDGERGFGVISLALHRDSGQPRTTVDLATHSERGDGWGSPVSRHLLTLDAEGRVRWIHRGDNRQLSRQTQTAIDFGIIVGDIESNFVAASEEGWLGQQNADDVIGDILRVMEQYTEGTRGVDHEFITRMKARVRTACAMYFVDFEGHGTWIQPDLLEHLGVLFRAFLTRNTSVMDDTWLKRGTWRHSPEVQQARLRLEYRKGDHARKEEFKRRDSHSQLKLDMSRILVWDKADLLRAPGQTLIRLHDVFDVPLFWLDPQVWKTEFFGAVAVDYHLEWVNEGSAVPRPTIENDNPDQAWLLPPGKKKRQEVPRERAHRWLTYRQLLQHEELRLAKDVD